jgi:hypothetical protein
MALSNSRRRRKKMWLSRKKFNELIAQATGRGYRLGYQAGQIEVINRLWGYIGNAKAVENRLRQQKFIQEIDDILKKSDGGEKP